MSAIDKRVAWVGVVLLLCFVLLFAQLNNLQVRQASALNTTGNDLGLTGRTTPKAPSPFFEPRGEIISADGVVLAYSKHTSDIFQYLRIYPKATARMFSSITGYYANAVAADPIGVEAGYDKYLADHALPESSVGVLLGQKEETDNVYLTISEKLQAAAMAAVDSTDKDGAAIVVLDPQNGDVLAMYGYPNYNPNTFSVHNPATVNKLANRDFNLQWSPLTNYAIAARNPPGSTMKVVTASAIFDHQPSIEKQNFPSYPLTYTFPDSGGRTIQNYNKESCGGNLSEIVAFSCDTAFAEVGVELGYEHWMEEANSFGFCSALPSQPESEIDSECRAQGLFPPIDLPAAVPAIVPPPSAIDGATPFEGYSAIGQFDDGATVLQMGMVASAIADNGTIMAPHVVTRAVNSYGETEFNYVPHVWRHATSAATAEAVRQLMTGVTQVPGATAQSLFASWYAGGGPVIAAKTGTAEPGENTCGTKNWLIALGPAAKGQTPTVAIAAMVPVTQQECDSGDFKPTGASVAGPVLLPVLKAALELQAAGKVP